MLPFWSGLVIIIHEDWRERTAQLSMEMNILSALFLLVQMRVRGGYVQLHSRDTACAAIPFISLSQLLLLPHRFRLITARMVC